MQVKKNTFFGTRLPLTNSLDQLRKVFHFPCARNTYELRLDYTSFPSPKVAILQTSSANGP